jgi:septal ring factor EnvC (AmiA/AmiB activator)
MARLKALEDQARNAARDVKDIEVDLLAAADDSMKREVAASQMEDRIATLSKELEQARSSFGENKSSLEDLLTGLIALETRRPSALAAHPDDATAAVRAAILMGDVFPKLSDRAHTLSRDITTRTNLITELRRQQDALSTQEAALAARREEINALAEERRRREAALTSETAELREQTRRLAADASNLRELLSALAKSAPASPGLKPRNPQDTRAAARTETSGSGSRPKSRQQTPKPPIVGRILRRYNQASDQGPSLGLLYAARANAQVVAPLGARIQFAGPFRSYGQMMILDVGDDVLVVVSGLDALYAEAGKQVKAGEPIGRMANRAAPAPELYFEVRRAGRTVDPETWLSRG